MPPYPEVPKYSDQRLLQRRGCTLPCSFEGQSQVLFARLRPVSPHGSHKMSDISLSQEMASIIASSSKLVDHGQLHRSVMTCGKRAPHLPRMQSPMERHALAALPISVPVSAQHPSAFRDRSSSSETRQDVQVQASPFSSQLGAHALMTRRTFSLLGDRSDAARPSSAAASSSFADPSRTSTTSRPPRLPGSVVGSGSQAKANSNLAATPRGQSLRHQPLSPGGKASVSESPSSWGEWTPRPDSESGMSVVSTASEPGLKRSSLRTESADRPRISKRVSFSGNCKQPPPSSIVDLLQFVSAKYDRDEKPSTPPACNACRASLLS